ncbi:MAG: hypothetical protein KGZ83_09400 [Sulfuricella sp.]|nr:hypothetical protein [Sulfuricella sp.]
MGYEIVWEPRGVSKVFFGHVTAEEFMQSLVMVESDPRFDDLSFVINDFLGVDSFAVGEDEVLMAAAIDKGAAVSNPNIKVAVLSDDAQIQALAELYAASPLNVYPTATFSDAAQARDWLARPLPRQAAFRSPIVAR